MQGFWDNIFLGKEESVERVSNRHQIAHVLELLLRNFYFILEQLENIEWFYAGVKEHSRL
jgi:hypothetical protein